MTIFRSKAVFCLLAAPLLGGASFGAQGSHEVAAHSAQAILIERDLSDLLRRLSPQDARDYLRSQQFVRDTSSWRAKPGMTKWELQMIKAKELWVSEGIDGDGKMFRVQVLICGECHLDSYIVVRAVEKMP